MWQPDSLEFGFFAREVVREMTSKTGQKCTAIRRVLVPDYHEQAAIDAISAQLKMTVVGDPANALVSMGPVVNMAQRKSIGEGIAQLNTRADVAYEPDNFSPLDADTERGAFVAPMLLRAREKGNDDVIHEIEVFGPVATVVSYRDKDDAFALARRGGGSLAASVFSADTNVSRRSRSRAGDDSWSPPAGGSVDSRKPYRTWHCVAVLHAWWTGTRRRRRRVGWIAWAVVLSSARCRPGSRSDVSRVKPTGSRSARVIRNEPRRGVFLLQRSRRSG